MKYNEVIAKSVELLQRIEKMGVGMEGGGPVEHQTGAFGSVEPEETDEDTEYTPKDISSEKPFDISPVVLYCFIYNGSGGPINGCTFTYHLYAKIRILPSGKIETLIKPDSFFHKGSGIYNKIAGSDKVKSGIVCIRRSFNPA